HALGVLRFYSITKGLNLKFEGLSFRFLERRTMSFELRTLIREVFDHSQKPHLKINEALEFIEGWNQTPHEHHKMCCGHDFAAIIGKALQSFIGSKPSIMTEPDEIQTKLRLTYSAMEFFASKLYQDLVDWQQRNMPFRCV
ncbi:MAG: hypothetical protein ACRYHQ_25460, partial [Janthinobacterium lividum]